MNNQQDDALVPVGIGNTGAQQRFIQGHKSFFVEFPKLKELCSKIFDRTLAPPDANERQALLDANLPDDDPAVVAWEDRVTARKMIFEFGLMACDDFTAVLILSANGAGFAAFVHLRSMYERLVTTLYFAKKPSESRRFAESSPGSKLNFLRRLLEAVPELKTHYNDAFMEKVQKDAEAVKAKQKESICPKCKEPKPKSGWTKADTYSMAREVDPELEKLYGVIYLEGTAQVHANSLGMERRLLRTESGYKYRGNSENEASLAVQFAHRLLLKFIDMQNKHFGLGNEQAIREQLAAYEAIWSESQASVNSTT